MGKTSQESNSKQKGQMHGNNMSFTPCSLSRVSSGMSLHFNNANSPHLLDYLPELSNRDLFLRIDILANMNFIILNKFSSLDLEILLQV